MNQIPELCDLPISAVLSMSKAATQLSPAKPGNLLMNKDNAESVGDSPKTNGNAYKRRNVYKAIIRRMFSYIQKEKSTVVEMLRRSGFSMEEIDSAFLYIRHLNDLDKQKGKSKRPQNTINVILETKTIYTYILKDTLWLMIQGWETGEKGKIMKDNVTIYKQVCENYYNRCIQLLTQPA